MIKLMRFLKPYRWLIVVISVLALGQALLNLFVPTLMANIIDSGVVKSDTAYIWRTGALMLAVAIAATLAAVGGIFFSARVKNGSTGE